MPFGVWLMGKMFTPHSMVETVYLCKTWAEQEEKKAKNGQCKVYLSQVPVFFQNPCVFFQNPCVFFHQLALGKLYIYAHN